MELWIKRIPWRVLSKSDSEKDPIHSTNSKICILKLVHIFYLSPSLGYYLQSSCLVFSTYKHRVYDQHEAIQLVRQSPGTTVLERNVDSAHTATGGLCIRESHHQILHVNLLPRINGNYVDICLKIWQLPYLARPYNISISCSSSIVSGIYAFFFSKASLS